MANPMEGYFMHRQGRYGPVYPRTPVCHGFTMFAMSKPGREEAIRARPEFAASATLPGRRANIGVEHFANSV